MNDSLTNMFEIDELENKYRDLDAHFASISQKSSSFENTIDVNRDLIVMVRVGDGYRMLYVHSIIL